MSHTLDDMSELQFPLGAGYWLKWDTGTCCGTENVYLLTWWWTHIHELHT